MEFESRLETSAERIGMATQDVAKLIPSIFEANWQARLALENCSASMAPAREDVSNQLQALLSDQFLLTTPWMWLTSFPRYLRGTVYRLQKLTAGTLDKDRRHSQEIALFWQQFVDRQRVLDAQGDTDPELETFRWMVEEYRISCFAQPLGTSIPISAKRLDKQWAKVGR